MNKLSACLALGLGVCLACKLTGTAHAQFGSHASMGWNYGSAQGYAMQGQSQAMSQPYRGLSRGMALDSSGHHLSYSYTVRMGDGRVIANSHHLGIDGTGSFYGSGRAIGYGFAEAGGSMTGPGMGSAYGIAYPSLQAPAWSASRTYSVR